jgi:hypothetical protein
VLPNHPWSQRAGSTRRNCWPVGTVLARGVF